MYVYAKEYFHPFNPAPEQGKPLIIVGPSGVGKMTLINQIIEVYGVLFERKKSVTSRPKREIEKQEQNYIFVSPEEFKKMIAENAFIECR